MRCLSRTPKMSEQISRNSFSTCKDSKQRNFMFKVITKLERKMDNFQDWLVSMKNTRTYIDIHTSMYHKCNSKLQPTRCNISGFIYFYRRSTCFRRFLHPSSWARNCTYSFRYCQPILLLAAVVDEMVLTYQFWCTVPSSWWWAEEPAETCRASVTYLLHGAESFLRS